MTTLICRHDAGFFSCCTVKLNGIISYINANKSLPTNIDCSKTWKLYNPYWLQENTEDITYNFFENNNNNITIAPYYNPLWYISDYNNTDNIDIIIKKYFTPNGIIVNNSNILIRKYKIYVNNCIGLYVRMTDKRQETNVGEFEDYKNKLNEILANEPKLKIIIVTDSTDFLSYIKEYFKSIIIIKELRTSTSTQLGIHKDGHAGRIDKTLIENNYNEILNYLFPAFLILSKCKYYICNSSNCSMWTILYRKSNKNVYEFSNNKWIDHFEKN
jgi:hypothetical protein